MTSSLIVRKIASEKSLRINYFPKNFVFKNNACVESATNYYFRGSYTTLFMYHLMFLLIQTSIHIQNPVKHQR